MNKKGIISLVLYFVISLSYAQITEYNHFPTFKPFHILDDKLEDISFAFSMRVLESDYNGPLIRLRRASDNALEDFGWADNDILDINAINLWRGTSNVFVHTWYDQSGLNRNAIQTTLNRQPRFFPDPNNPHFQGDGGNDHLTIDTPNGIQDLTNNGDQGSVLGVMRATRKSQHSFGVLVNRNRWSTHINWSDNNLYFDPGICCNTPRSFNNTAAINNWVQYTFLKTDTNVITRSSGIQHFNGTHTRGKCTRTEDFTISWANGNQPNQHSTTSFTELVMYKTNINSTQYLDIEENTTIFWGL